MAVAITWLSANNPIHVVFDLLNIFILQKALLSDGIHGNTHVKKGVYTSQQPTLNSLFAYPQASILPLGYGPPATPAPVQDFPMTDPNHDSLSSSDPISR